VEQGDFRGGFLGWSGSAHRNGGNWPRHCRRGQSRLHRDGIQTVNKRNSRFTGLSDRSGGICAKYLNFLRWFERIKMVDASWRSYPTSAINGECIRI